MAPPDWEVEAKRAFWAGLEIGACFGSVSILPCWNEYITKRKGELLSATPQPYTALETIEKFRNASNPNARDPLEILAELRGTEKQGA